MGCTSSDIQTDQEGKKIRYKKNKISSEYTIDNSEYSLSTKNSKLDERLKNDPNLTKEQIDIIQQFNSKFKNSKGIQISTLSKYQIFSNQENTNIISIQSNEQFIKTLNEINPLIGNIDENKNFMMLKSNLNKAKTKEKITNKISSIKNFNLNLTQIIHGNYKFKIELRKLKNGNFDIFDFNKLDKPILIIFFDILSNKAIEKIKEVKKYNKEVKGKEKDFLFFPILNIFFNENDNLNSQKNFLEISNLDDCYILTNPKNKPFIKLFELDCLTESKVVIINHNSEISFILNDNIQFLTIEIIEFYLHSRKSEYENNYFEEKTKDKITNIFQSIDYKKFIENFKHDFLIEVLFKEIDNKKYPVHFNYMYNSKDEKNAKNFLNKIKRDLDNNVKKFFIAISEVKKLKGEMIDAFNFINDIFIKNKFKTNSKNYILNSSIETFIGNLKKKKYCLYFNLLKDDSKNFSKILNILSANLYNNPQFANLGIGYSIIPQKEVKLKINHIKCKLIKLFKNKNDQMTYEEENKEIDYKLDDEIVILLNPNYYINNENEKEKIVKIFELLMLKNIKFTICIFSYSDIDCQKLRYLNFKDLILENFTDDYNDKLNLIYINSSLIENYCFFSYYSEDITFKLLKINLDNSQLINFIHLDKISLFSILSFKNDIDLISYWSNLNDNNIDNENKKFDYTSTKEKYFNLFTESKYLNQISKNKIFTNLNLKILYEKNMSFTNKNNFSDFNIDCIGFNISFSYQDTLKEEFKLNSLITECKKKERKYPNIFTYNLNELKTRNLYLKNTNCSMCKKGIKIENMSFFYCKECKEKFTICLNCYNEICFKTEETIEDDFILSSLIMSKDKIKNNDKNKNNNKIFHEHPLIFIYNYNKNFLCCYFKDIYDKFKNMKKKRNNICLCPFCDNYIYNDSTWLNVVISHFKNNFDSSTKSKFDEIFICENCFEKKEFEKFNHEINLTKQNLLVMKICNKIN